MRKKAEILESMIAMLKEIEDPLYHTDRINLHLIEVLIDIRDILRSETSGIARSLYIISKQP